MTLKEIAKEAGVSVSTVSRVINRSTKSVASAEVQERIWEIVRRTGYTPNSTARELKKGSASGKKTLSHSIACIFARITTQTADAFFNSLARGIEKEAFAHNYLLKYTFTAFDFDKPETFRIIANTPVDGVAVLGRCDKQMLKFLKQHYRCVAYTGLNNLDAKYDQIICDGHQAAFTAVNHLLQLGHTKIAYVGETKHEDRYIGYLSALEAAKLPVRNDYISNVLLSSEGGYEGMKQLFKRNADLSAVFCCNDITAIGVMKAIQEQGLSIPNDISIISIDDIDMVQYLTPMLTTIHVPVEDLGSITAKVLIDRIEGGHSLPMRISLPFYIANRESCCTYTSKKKG